MQILLYKYICTCPQVPRNDVFSFLLQCVFGTNPLSFAAPSTGDPFVLDMATSTAAIGKVQPMAEFLK